MMIASLATVELPEVQAAVPDLFDVAVQQFSLAADVMQLEDSMRQILSD